MRFNMSVQILAMEGLPAKYKNFRVMLQRGGKVLTSGGTKEVRIYSYMICYIVSYIEILTSYKQISTLMTRPG